MVAVLELFVVGRNGLDRVLVPRPVSAGHADHGIPRNRLADNLIRELAAVENQAEATVDRLADANAAAVMERNQAHAARRVAGEAVGCHVSRELRAVVDIGSLAVGRIRAAGVVVVAAQHDRSDFPVPHHLVEAERNVSSAECVLVENTALGADNQFVLVCVANPDPVVSVLEAAVRVYNLHGRVVGL